MQLVRYSPRKDMVRLEQELEKTFGSTRDWQWPVLFQDPSMVDMYTEDDKLIVKATLPGFKKEEIKLNVKGGTLEVTAGHEEKGNAEVKRGYLIHESTQSYYRQLALPEGAVTDDIEAVFDDGILTVTMPMEERVGAKEVAIK